MLEQREECLDFDPYFVSLVDKVVVGKDKKLEFNFRNKRRFWGRCFPDCASLFMLEPFFCADLLNYGVAAVPGALVAFRMW